MAHKWITITQGGASWNGNRRRRCENCDKEQTHIKWTDTLGTTWWKWRPLAGRCPSTKDGRVAKRRNAILAAIRDGRHTPRGIAAHASIPIATVRTALSLAKRQGYVVNSSRGRWELGPAELEKESDEQNRN